MTKVSLALLCIFLLAFSIQEIHSSTLNTLTNAFASKNGEVTIWKDASGFYVEADLSFNAYSNINVTKMLISFCNSETTLMTDCLGFDQYNCLKHDCTEQQGMTFIHYPKFMTWGHSALADTYLDYSNWELKTKAYLGAGCQTSAAANYGKGRGGVIGLGISGDTVKNFIGSKVFSVSLNPGFTGGKLLWKFDSSLATSEKLITLGTDDNWSASLKNAGFTVGRYGVPISDYLLVFDFHTDVIGFPLATFNVIMVKFKEYSGITCTEDKYKPTCDLYGEIASLPEITFHFGTAQTLIRIPPEIYLEDGTTPKQTKITLNFKATDPELFGENFVSPAFKDTIILGAYFMKYYYTVFDASQKTISLYVHGSSPSSSYLIYIILGVVALIAIIGAGAVYFIKKKKSSNASLAVPDYSSDIPNNNYPRIQQP